MRGLDSGEDLREAKEKDQEVEQPSPTGHCSVGWGVKGLKGSVVYPALSFYTSDLGTNLNVSIRLHLDTASHKELTSLSVQTFCPLTGRCFIHLMPI